MATIRFGPGGIPIQCKGHSTLEGLECCAQLGLDAMEMEFVRGVYMKKEAAAEVKVAAAKLDIALSSHAPYFVNLCSKEQSKAVVSRRNILEAAHATFLAGGTITVFHPGYYQNNTPEEAYQRAKKNLREIEDELRQKNIRIRLGAEVVGKKSQFGGLEEVIRLSQELNMVVPVIDFCHLHARGDFPFRKKDDYAALFKKLEKELPDYTNDFHSHFAEVRYSDKGELNHMPLGSCNQPPFKSLMEMLAEQGYSGRIISESPRLDYDAQKMQAEYVKFRTGFGMNS